ncbi:hypothetical protein ETB97_006033 [Aspergillus alliaceus]|uniref:Uncharacterized protein n=2 Tax=Petromyces alliaceus TaxID=209559 RepID=A0A8H6E2L6_PETAA|nr:hypothetical protein ETB97_006033 [Aspergillus burnettii]
MLGQLLVVLAIVEESLFPIFPPTNHRREGLKSNAAQYQTAYVDLVVDHFAPLKLVTEDNPFTISEQSDSG